MRFELSLLPLFLLLSHLWITSDITTISVFSTAYFLSSLFLSPDLDLRANSSRRRWGQLGWLWALYAKLFKHRGVSHSITWGLLTRLAYLGALIASVGIVYQQIGLVIPLQEIPEIRIDYWLALILGLYVPNLLHILLDHIMSGLARSRRQKKVDEVRQIGG